MKKLNCILGFVLIFQLASCNKTIHINRSNGVSGSGNLITSSIEVGEFNELELAVVFDVELVHSEEEKVILNVDDNLIDLIDVENNNGVLKITKTKGSPNINKSKGRIEVHFRSLSRINNASVGNLTTRSIISGNKLSFKNTSVGNTSLNLEAENLEMTNSAVGNLTLEGKVDYFSMKNTGVGNVNAKSLIAKSLNLTNSAIGNTRVYVSETSIIKNSAVGDLKIHGPGKIDQVKNTGVGKFSKLD